MWSIEWIISCASWLMISSTPPSTGAAKRRGRSFMMELEIGVRGEKEPEGEGEFICHFYLGDEAGAGRSGLDLGGGASGY